MILVARLLCLVLAATAVGCATVPQPGEHLQQAVPIGYRVIHQDSKGAIVSTEMAPEGQSASDWIEMLRTQVYYGLKSVKPEEFRAESQRKWLQQCPEGKYLEVMSGEENGYPAAIWLLSCPYSAAPGRPEFIWSKAIRGSENFYAVQKLFRFEPSTDQARFWMNQLRRVAVCDNRVPEHACP